MDDRGSPRRASRARRSASFNMAGSRSIPTTIPSLPTRSASASVSVPGPTAQVQHAMAALRLHPVIAVLFERAQQLVRRS